MATFTFDEINKAFESLPKNLEKAIFAIDYQQRIQEISKKNLLAIDKIGLIESQVTLILIGLAKPEDFGKDVLEATGLPKETINAVVRDINEQIFKPIRARMMELDEEDRILAEPDEPEANEVTQIEIPSTNPGTTVETFPTEITGKVTPFVKAPTGSQNIVTEKLQAPHGVAPTTTSHDLPSMSTVRTYKGSDPYREAPEEPKR